MNALTRYATRLVTVILIIAVFYACKKDGAQGEDLCRLPTFSLKSFKEVSHPCGLAVSASGLIAVTTYNGFQQYGAIGKTRVWKNYSDLLTLAAPIAEFDNHGAEAIAFDKDNNLYVAETEQVAGIAVYRRVANGYTYVQTIQGGFNNPRGLAIADDGKLYIADDGNKRIIRVPNPLTSNQMEVWANNIGSVKGLAISGNDLYITQFDKNTVVKLEDFGRVSYTLNVEKPTDIAVNGNTVLINSYETGVVYITRAENFGNECAEIWNPGKGFALAFVNQAGQTGEALLYSAFDDNKILFHQVVHPD